MTIYRLLGELEISHDGPLVELPGGPTLVVLAALLVNANRRMSKTELIRAAWGNDEATEAQLYKRVMAVRALLTKIGRRDDLKTHARFGYEIRIPEESADTLQFQQRVRDATEAGASQRTEDEISFLRQALELWRGPHPLSNVPSAAFSQEVAALEQRRKRAAARLFELELARGNHELIVDELMSLAGSYPADRRLTEQLMIAQYRCGHLADVSGAYERYREALAEETGAPPDPLLRALHYAVAGGDEAAIAEAQSALAKRAGTPARPAVSVPRQLPRPPDLVGRDDLVAEVSWLLRAEPNPAMPVVVISGPGGIGKTALALRAAHESADRFPGGQLYLELRGTAGGAVDTSEALAQFLRALGAPRVPETTAERFAAYRTLLADRRVLVVLDDAADGAQVADMVPANPWCAVLVTARQRLPEVSGAHHVAPLEPLPPAEATELFLRVVRDAGIELDDDLDAIAGVVALCGGLPLALRIAGALRVHDHPRPTRELANRLARQGPEGFAYRELSVARTIGAGFDRLDEGGRQLFLGLGLLPLTGFGLWTAAALLGHAGVDAAATLSQLTASFMIESVESQLRYRFHDLTREYARRRALAEYRGDRRALPGRIYRALLTLARRAHAHLYGGDFELVHSGVADWDAPAEVLAEVDDDPLAWFEKERDNIRAAVEHCAALGLTETCWDLAVSAHEFYTIRCYYDDWYVTHTVALSTCRQAGDRRGEGIVLACLNQPALVASRRAGEVSGLADLQRAVDLLAECGDQHGQAIALRTLAHALRRQGHLTQALALFHEALTRYEASEDTVGRWQALRFTGQTHLDLGNHAGAHRALTEAKAVAGEIGNNRLIAQARYWAGEACLAGGDLGNHAGAHRALAEAKAVAGEIGDRRLIAQARYWAGEACLAGGDLDGAQAEFDVVFAMCRDDTGLGHAYAVHGLGDLARYRGNYDAAGRYLAEAAGLVRDGADALLEGRVLLSTAALCQAQGQLDEQVAALEQAVGVFAGCGAAYLEAPALAALAGALAGRGDAEAASAAWDRIEDLYNAAGLPDEDRIHRRPDR